MRTETISYGCASVERLLKKTPLHGLHLELGAKMVAFAGYDMPVYYPSGILWEHRHTRQSVGLFDVSHMGQARMTSMVSGVAVGDLLETLMPNDLTTLNDGQTRYGCLTNIRGGILDDVMVTRLGESLWFVVNAICKETDFSYIETMLSEQIQLERSDYALLALQGPKSSQIIESLFPKMGSLSFMYSTSALWEDVSVMVTRCGYTGEDGFEISLPVDIAENFARKLLSFDDVMPIGLGARDSLRLEAGLCLYGHDIDETTTPIEANLLWTIPKSRRGIHTFIGAEVIQSHIEKGADRLRVGILPSTRVPVREGAEVQNVEGDKIGVITSGCFSPSLEKPIAMGYVHTQYAKEDTSVYLVIRGKRLLAHITNHPFIPHQYRRTS